MYDTCCKKNIKLIHLSTDCIFSGSKGNYSEEDIPDARAASKIIEAIDKLLLEIDLDPKPLLEEAASLEKELQKVSKQLPADGNNQVPRYIG